MIDLLMIIASFIILIIVIQYTIVISRSKGVPILLYHNISEYRKDGLTIRLSDLENQFEIIKKNGYQTISFKDLIESYENEVKLPSKPIILTFDDGYLNSYKYLCLLLKKFQFNISIFLPVGLIGKMNYWDEGKEQIINYKEIQSVNDRLIEFGLHSYSHLNYKSLTLHEIESDIQLSIENLSKYNISFIPVIAYPYGGFPRNRSKFKVFREILMNNGIKIGLRIGNRINRIPIKDIYKVKRIDIKGTDTISEFITKLKKGRIKLF